MTQSEIDDLINLLEQQRRSLRFDLGHAGLLIEARLDPLDRGDALCRLFDAYRDKVDEIDECLDYLESLSATTT